MICRAIRLTVASGILLASVPVSCGSSSLLAQELYEEGAWWECSREAARLLTAVPSNRWPELWWAASRVRVNPADAAALAVLENLASLPSEEEPGNWAAYELARIEWRQGRRASTVRHLRRVFLHTQTPILFRRSSSALALMARHRGFREEVGVAIQLQLQSCRSLFAPQMAADFFPLRDHPRLQSKPGEWLVAVYRRLIGPAIGARCSLEPSCSAYFLEASRRHGLLALPIGADRFVREPSVIAEGQHPVQTTRGLRFADPLSDHDGWLPGARRHPKQFVPCPWAAPFANKDANQDAASTQEPFGPGSPGGL